MKSVQSERVVAFAAALTVLVGCAVGMGAAIKAFNLHLQKLAIHPADGRVLPQIPAETPSWVRIGTDRIESPEVVEVLGTENYVSRNYVRKNPADPDRPMVLDFHAAYYTGMIDTVPHVPERCFVGGGLVQASASSVLPVPMDTTTWVPDTTVPAEFAGESGQIYTVRLPNPPFSDAPGQRIRLPRDVTPQRPVLMRVSGFDVPGAQNMYSGYFFIANGGTVANANDVRTLAFDLTSDYAYYMKVQVTSTTVGSEEELAEQAGSLLGELIGEIMRCVPDWVEVQAGRHPGGEAAGVSARAD
jgi:hypothetical protein